MNLQEHIEFHKREIERCRKSLAILEQFSEIPGAIAYSPNYWGDEKTLDVTLAKDSELAPALASARKQTGSVESAKKSFNDYDGSVSMAISGDNGTIVLKTEGGRVCEIEEYEETVTQTVKKFRLKDAKCLESVG